MQFMPQMLRVRRGSAGARSARHRLSLEPLEIRDLMAAMPLTLVNGSTINPQGDLAYQDNQIWVAIYAQKQEDLSYWYFDQSGVAHSVAGQSDVPSYLLSSFTAAGPAHTYTINLPDVMPGSSFGPKGARMYFGFGEQPLLPIVGSNEVQAMQPNSSYFDFIEFTINGDHNGTPQNNLNIDTTSVDQFGAPIHVEVVSSELSGGSYTIGIAEDRADVIEQFQAFTSDPNDPYAICIWPDSGSYGTYRIQNPSDIIKNAETQNTSLQVQSNLRTTLLSGAQYTTVNVEHTWAFPLNPANDNFVIQIDGEQMLVTSAAPGPNGSANWTVARGHNGTTITQHLANAVVTRVGPVIDTVQTNLTMANTKGYPDPSSTPFYVQVGAEIMKVVGLAGENDNGTTTWFVQRAQFGSTAASHANMANVYWNSMRDNPLNAWFNEAIDALFKTYENPNPPVPLLIKSNADGNTYEGRVVHEDEANETGPMVLRFNLQGNPSSLPNYDIYYPFFEENRYFWGGYSPDLAVGNAPPDVVADSAAFAPSYMVFGCLGVFSDSAQRSGLSLAEQGVLGDLENQVVAALNRGVALVNGDGADSWKQTELYYRRGGNATNQAYNRYAAFLHQDTVSYQAQNYGFAYDDNNGQASDIGISDLNTITSVTATLGAWADGDAPPPPPPPPPPGPGGMSLRDYIASFLRQDPHPIGSSMEQSSFWMPVDDAQKTEDEPSAEPQAIDAAIGELAAEDADPAEDDVVPSIVRVSIRNLTARGGR